MHHEAHHSTTGEVLRTTREALTRTGYALVGAGAWVLDAVRRERPPEELRHVGQRTAEWTRDGSRLAAEGFRTLTDHGRAVLPEPDEVREQARSAAEEAAAAARELAGRPAPAEGGLRSVAPTERAEEPPAPADEQPADGDTLPGVDYAELTVAELREHARDADIHGRSQMNKAELVAALEQHAGE